MCERHSGKETCHLSINALIIDVHQNKITDKQNKWNSSKAIEAARNFEQSNQNLF